MPFATALNQAFFTPTRLLWAIVLGGALAYWPFCADYTHVPRFLALALGLLAAWLLLRRELQQEASWNLFDAWLLGWFVWNAVSISWSLSASEGVFYAQKVLLLLLSFRFFRHLLRQNAAQFRQTLGQLSLVLILVYGLLVGIQLIAAWQTGNLSNAALYGRFSGYLGNKSLAAEFLVLLLGLYALAGADSPLSQRFRMVYWLPGLLVVLMLALQVRTALLALLAGGMVYALARVWSETRFRSVWVKKVLPAILITAGMLTGILVWRESSVLERLNPLSYLDSDTANERRFVWYKTDVLNADHYWLGVGTGSWKFWLPSKGIEGGYRQMEGNVVFTRAHNDYLEVRSENGMIGAILFCGLWVLALGLGGRALGKTPGMAAAMGACVAYGVIQFFDFPRERMEFQVLMGIFLAFLTSGARAKPLPQAVWWWRLAVLGAGLAVFTGLCRLRGEIHLNRMMEAQSAARWREVAQEAKKAENPCYQYTDAAMPIAWHAGVAQYQLGVLEKSVNSLERAYQLNPWSFQVIHNYASALVKAGRLKEAVSLFEQALSINPRYDEGKFNLCYVYARLGDTLTARSWLNRIDTIPNPGTPADEEKNRATLRRLGEFRAVLGE